jgi:cathepsin X
MFHILLHVIVPIKTYPVITLKEFGMVSGEENIMAEIYERGPVSANINANCLEDYTGGIETYEECNNVFINHVIQLNGWGTDENGVDYWIGRNSWGTYWGKWMTSILIDE